MAAAVFALKTEVRELRVQIMRLHALIASHVLITPMQYAEYIRMQSDQAKALVNEPPNPRR